MRHVHSICRLSGPLLMPLLVLGCSGPDDRDLSSLRRALDIQVPGDYATIQAAVESAGDGDVIVVAPGNYSEDVDVLSKSITISGDATQRPRLLGTFYFSNSVSSLSNFEVVGPSGYYSGIRAYSSELHAEFVHVTGFDVGVSFSVGSSSTSTLDRSVVSGNGTGVLVENGADLRMVNDLVLFNTGNGVRATASGEAQIFSSTLVSNGAYLSGDAGISCAGNCTVSNAIMVNNDIGLDCAGSCSADYNLVWGNWTNYGSGTAVGSKDVSADPRFVDPAEYDFHLQEDSPAVDAGAELAYAGDYEGVPRPQGDGWDMGAYEYVKFTSGTTLTINEIMANPIDEGTGEFIELYNYGDQAVDAAGLIIWDGDATDVLSGYQGGSTIIAAGSYAVILDPDYAGEYTIAGGIRLLSVASSATIGNGLSTSDPVSLWESNGVTRIDRFSFPSNPGNGVSVEKISIEEGDIYANWAACPCGATPGTENCASQPSNVSHDILIAVNEVMANPLNEGTGEFIELYNFGPDTVDLAGYIITDGDSNDEVAGWQGGTTILLPGDYGIILDPDYAGEYTIPGSAVLLTVASSATIGNGLAISDLVSLLDPTGQSVVDTYSRPLDPGNGTSVEKVDATIGDVPSNWAASTCAAGSSPGTINCVTEQGGDPVSGNTIAIMEVMANPLDEDSGEYIELFNYGDQPLDVAGWRVDDGDATDTIEGYLGGTTIIPAGGYALILDREYANDYSLPGGVVLLTTDDTTIGSGLSTNDPIFLRAATGSALVDSYSFPFNAGNGISVEKIDLVVGDVPQNWIASPCNGSPGGLNCASSGSSSPDLSSTHLVISEVMANPLDEGSGEYIELFNASPVAVDVAGFVISDGDAIDVVQGYQGGSTSIGAGEYALILDSGYAGDYSIESGAVLLTVANATLGNSLSTNDPVTLFEADAMTVVDTFSYPTNPGNGVSIEKRVLTAGDTQGNWTACTCLTGNGAANDYASPGFRNCSDPGNGITGDQVMGESCPYGSVDCLSGICLFDLFNFETYCTEDCSGTSCAGGFHCETLEDIWGIGYTELCVRD